MRFEANVNGLFARLLEKPFQFPEIETSARRALVRHFPYVIFFTVDDDLVTVLAVLHAHQRPDTWKRGREGSN